MKKSNLSPLMFFLSLFLFIHASKGQVNNNNGEEMVIKKISESAKGTKIDSSILEAAIQRDSIAAEKLRNEYLQPKKKKKQKTELERREISSILTLDNDRPELHLQLAKSSLADFREYQQKGYEDLTLKALDAIWQELEWFKIKGIEKEFTDSIAVIRQNLPPRPSQDTFLTKELLAEAQKTFQTGKGIYIYYPENKSIEFERGNSVYNVMNAPTIYLRYIRSPHYPPTACRVVTFMMISKDGKESQPEALAQGYEACVFPTGILTSFYMIFGSIDLKPDTKIFIYAESLFNDPAENGKKSVIISNTLAIPVIYKK